VDDPKNPGNSLADRINSKFWKPSSATPKDYMRKPLEPGTPWGDPYAQELARARPAGRMQVDSVPESLAKADKQLYTSPLVSSPMPDIPEMESKIGSSSIWKYTGQGRDDAAIASMLVMGPGQDADISRGALGICIGPRLWFYCARIRDSLGRQNHCTGFCSVHNQQNLCE
jgi:hypothetical protein